NRQLTANFRSLFFEYEKQELTSMKHKCLSRYHEDIHKISRKEGVPFISEANLQSAHRKIEDDIVKYYKKQTLFDDRLSPEVKSGLEEIKKDMKKILDNKVKDNLEEEKVYVMEAKYISIFKYSATMNQTLKESNCDFITNTNLREKHEKAKEVALQFYRDVNHFDKHHPSQIAMDTLKELEERK
ncbi:unnamed protein product, partial [Meganyctiphanes norvegica]